MNRGTSNLRVAAITGAAQGIGQRTALLLGERGYALALNDLRACGETLAELRRRGAEAIECVGDVCEEAVAARFAAAVRERWGGVDALVNNAGVSFIAPAEMVSAQDFRRVLEINLVAPFLMAKAFGAMMLQRGSGSIVNVASIAGVVGIADRSAYNASKHGLIGLTRTLASEWGGRGVRGSYTDADITGRVPMARFAAAEDVARAIAFLADPAESGFVNGHTLVVDGGWTADGSWESLRLAHR
jgi:NAD(P)-dependent dehydrogenase (short-subunit alcohol dehydrogenase family)